MFLGLQLWHHIELLCMFIYWSPEVFQRNQKPNVSSKARHLQFAQSSRPCTQRLQSKSSGYTESTQCSRIRTNQMGYNFSGSRPFQIVSRILMAYHHVVTIYFRKGNHLLHPLTSYERHVMIHFMHAERAKPASLKILPASLKTLKRLTASFRRRRLHLLRSCSAKIK